MRLRLRTRAALKGVQTHERRLSKGAEELSWLQNHINWIGQNASHWTREKFKSQARLLISDPAMQERSDLQDMARTYVQNMLSADPQVAKTINRVTCTWLMGFNFGSALVNATQLMTRGVAEFTNITGKPLDSYKRMLRSYGEMMGAAQGKGWAGEHDWVVKQMKDEGIVGATMFDEDSMQNEKTATNLKRALAKNRPQSLGQFLGTLAGQYSNISYDGVQGNGTREQHRGSFNRLRHLSRARINPRRRVPKSIRNEQDNQRCGRQSQQTYWIVFRNGQVFEECGHDYNVNANVHVGDDVAVGKLPKTWWFWKFFIDCG